MNKALNHALVIATLATVGTAVCSQAEAQVAGTTTVGVAVAEITEVTNGWSAKNNVLGKAVYNEAGHKVGAVEDLIISPSKHLSYLIIGAGGFVGIGRHDVAIPVAQIQNKDGRFVLPGASKDAIKALPEFKYATDTSKRDQFVAKADHDVAKAKAKLSALELSAANANANAAAKVKLEQQVVGFKKDLKIAEDKLAELNRADANHWEQFEGGVSSAMARLRKWVETSAS
jgi:sporulation protein YlmC with PRC-barrel domain